jgi:1,4-alpha-glucan branching enzyme
LLFMGGEFGQWREWTETESLDWHLLESALHSGIQKLIRDLNRIYLDHDALWRTDAEAAGFEWIDVDNAAENIVAFIRRSPEGQMICVANFSAVPKSGYRLGVPREGRYKVLLNTDQKQFGGRAEDEIRVMESESSSLLIDLPPLTTIWLEDFH